KPSSKRTECPTDLFPKPAWSNCKGSTSPALPITTARLRCGWRWVLLQSRQGGWSTSASMVRFANRSNPGRSIAEVKTACVTHHLLRGSLHAPYFGHPKSPLFTYVGQTNVDALAAFRLMAMHRDQYLRAGLHRGTCFPRDFQRHISGHKAGFRRGQDSVHINLHVLVMVGDELKMRMPPLGNRDLAAQPDVVGLPLRV